MPPFTWVGDGFRCALPILRTCAPSTSLRAKRSNPSISVLSHGLLRCARNDVDTVSPSRGAFAPELCLSFRPQIKRAQGMPGAGWHPRSRVQIALVVAHTSIQVQPEQPGIPCAMVLRLIPCSPWRRIPFASIAGGLKDCRNPVGSTFLRRLDTSNGCQNHTALPYAASPVVYALCSLTDFRPALPTPPRAQRCRVHRNPPQRS